MNQLLYLLIIIAVLPLLIIFKKRMQYWIFPYLGGCLFKNEGVKQAGPVDIIFCFVDHFEPKRGLPGRPVEKKRMDFWADNYPFLAGKHRDSDGIMPRHTFFYPAEEYEEEYIDTLARLCRKGFGEVEIHLHHDKDTAEGLKIKIEEFKGRLAKKGLLAQDKSSGEFRYAFIHGVWALGNSLPGGRCCGVNNELSVLRQTGCFADFTLPAAYSCAQTSKINSIYYACDTGRPKPHDTGIDVEKGKPASGDLMIIQGPLALNFRARKFGIFPKIEHGEISFNDPPTKSRVDLWVSQRITVKNKPDWVFVKIYTHGVRDDNLDKGYFDGLDKMFGYLEARYNDGRDHRLHYVTAREMYNIIMAAQEGKEGNPHQYRDYALDKPAACKG